MPWFEQEMFWHDTQMGLWIVWKGTSWYGLRKLLDWKGTRGMVWVGRYLNCGK
jgi:hypothetical protein